MPRKVRPVKGDLAAILLAWYDRHARVLPWRARGRERADPYRVWLSEIMLQQTTVAAVGPYFRDFLTRWPDVGALAAAPLDDVLGAWAGLGYYARARNLHKCAQHVANTLGGRFPESETALRELPGVGPYTAAAISAIAFDRRAVVVDGNVERVMARLFAIETPLPKGKPVLWQSADRLTPARRAGDYAQAVMDLGATICTPRSPRCLRCPWSAACAAHKAGAAERYPVRAPKPERPTKRGVAFVLVKDEQVWLRRRPDNGLLGGMLEAPSTPWRAQAWKAEAARAHAPVAATWEKRGTVHHGFTHFAIELQVWSACPNGRSPDDGAWCHVADFGRLALPTLTRKVIEAALQPPLSQPLRQPASARASPRIMAK